MDTADGAVFVKQASGEAGALSMLRREALVYSRVSGSFLPACVGFADRGDCALLALEYLSDAWWPPPYPDDATPLFATLGLVASTKPPEDLPAEGRRWSRWQRIAEDPEPLLGLRLCSRNWLEHSLEALIAAEARARFRRGRARPQRRYAGNVCFTSRGAVLVDWGAGARGSRWVDVAFAILSVRVEGGIVPAVDFPDEGASPQLSPGTSLTKPRHRFLTGPIRGRRFARTWQATSSTHSLGPPKS
jgi:hypothetical protein